MAWGWLLGIAGLKLAVHLACLGRYGYFRDELYFLDCGRHLQWGYVDDAPLIALLARLSLVLGGSLQAVRLLPALAGAGTVILAGKVAQALGGRGFAQVLAGLCVLAAPVFLVSHGLLCVGAFEPLVWLGFAWLALRIARTGEGRLWIAFGLLAGVGVLLKYTTGLVLVCFLAGLAASPLRRQARNPLFYAGAALAVLLFLPTLVWQVRNHWPLLVDLANIRRTHKNVELPPLRFLAQQAWMVNPLLAPVWITGLVRLLRRPATRFLGVWFLTLLGALMALHGKDYYLAALYPMLFAAGAVALEAHFEGRGFRWAALGLVTALAALLVPAFTPLLAPERLLAYQGRLGIHETKQERSFDARLMQPFADQFGWREVAMDTAALYYSLPPEERARTGIYADNYGEAGAIAQFGPALGLPPVICAHNAYSFWGPPARTPATILCIGCDRPGLEREFASVQAGPVHHHPWGMGYENGPIYLCRGPRRTLAELWPRITWWN
jgi:uncharacterized membrane protein YiaA